MTAIATQRVPLLSAADINRSLRSALNRRFPGTGTIGPWVRLSGLRGYDESVAAELLTDAFAAEGLAFRHAEIVSHSATLADLIVLVDRVVASRLHVAYVR